MRDASKPNPEEAFIAMMKDFATTYAGKNPSTLDFQRMVEKHATKTLKRLQGRKAGLVLRPVGEGDGHSAVHVQRSRCAEAPGASTASPARSRSRKCRRISP